MAPIVVLVLVVVLVAGVVVVVSRRRREQLERAEVLQFLGMIHTAGPAPGSGGPVDTDTPVGRLLAELATIGRGRGFLTMEGKDPRTREIGAELFRIDGKRQMLDAHGYVRAELGPVAARELEAAWDGIGSWLG